MRAAALLCLFVLSGCGSEMYSKDGGTAQQFEIDKARCEQEAFGAVTPVQSGRRPAESYTVQSRTVGGTTTSTVTPRYGHGSLADAYAAGRNSPAAQRREYVGACLRAQGYVPAR